MKETQGQARVIAAAARACARRLVLAARFAVRLHPLHRLYSESCLSPIPIYRVCYRLALSESRVFARRGLPLGQGRVNDLGRQSSRRAQ
jgi:hypothetical protein